MLREMIIGASLVVSANVFAANWELVDDTADGKARLLVNTESLWFSSYNVGNGNKSTMAGVAMTMIDVRSGEEQVFTANIDVFECLEKNSGMLVLATSSSEAKKYYWTSSGSKMYDAKGRWLCGATRLAYQRYLKNKESETLKPNM